MELFIRLIGVSRFLFKLAAGLSISLYLSLPGHAQTITTTTTLTSTPNPSAINQTITLTAKIGGARYAAPFSAGVGRAVGAREYIRYELVDTTFGRDVVAADFTNLTTPAAFAGKVVAVGGAVGDKIVVMDVSIGGTGLSATDNLQFNFSPGALSSTSAIKFSVHDTLSSAVGVVPLNDSLVFGPTSVLISSLSPPFALTGNVNFRQNAVTITGCGSVAVSAGAAACSTVIGPAGTYAMTADYSGNLNYFSSSGTLAGGQSVGLGVTPPTVAGLVVGQTFSQVFSSSGGTAPYSFAISSGTLPAGLTLATGGTLSGTPTATGTYTFVVRVTDAAALSGGVSITATVNKGSQTITFTPPANAVLGTTYTLNAVASSGLQVVYSIANQSVCTANGNILSFVATGLCRVTPMQSGDTNYLGAPTSERVINVVTTGSIKPMRLRSANGQSVTAELSSNNTLFFTAAPDPGVNFRANGIADLDGNKSPDLIYQNVTQGDSGEVRAWKDFDSSQDRSLRSARLLWRLDATGDLDGDGFGDLVWRFTGSTANAGDTGVSYVWFTNGTAVTQVRKRGGAPLDWTLLGAIDVNADGAADMIYISPTNEIRVLMATPNRTCANLSAGFLPTGFTALKAGPFVRTGRPEVLMRNVTTGEVRLLILDGTGFQLPAATADPNDPNASCTSSTLRVLNLAIPFAFTDPSWMFFGTADFNGDGFLDVVWKRPDGSLYLWLTSGSDLPLSGIANAGAPPAGFTPIQP